MRVEDFALEYPEIWSELLKGRDVKTEQFWYHRRKLYVLRKEPSDWSQPFDEHFELSDKRSPARRFSVYGNNRLKNQKVQVKLA